MVRKESHYLFKIKSFIKDRYGEVTLDEIVRNISVFCDKLKDALLREGKERTGVGGILEETKILKWRWKT